ncbi:RHO1 GDP-GTP exchange protein 2 [Entomortierella lignicola]|nr:RHO1 GDP-GTP exchange protein 2 [Entomortierella lignicola]
MATYTTPPSNAQGSGNRVNPLAPVTYTPQSSYVPSTSKKERIKSILRPNNSVNNNNLNRNPSNISDISSASTLYEDMNQHLNGSPSSNYPLPPIQHQHPSSQNDYQQHYQAQYGYNSSAARRSAEQLSSVGHNGSVWEPASQRQLAQQSVYHPSMAKLSQVNEEEVAEPRQSFQTSYNDSFSEIQRDVSSLNISSPPRQRPYDNSTNNFNHNSFHQQQPYQTFDQHQPAQPYAEGHNYPQPSPTPSSFSKLHRTSTGSSTTHTSWSQPSSPGFPPSSYNGGLNDESLQLSEAALQLTDFNPGILSTIAVAFSSRMLQNETKRKESEDYNLGFLVTFTGKEAVDVIVDLTNTEDRHHALAIARSLEQQQLFYGGGENILFDSNNDQYFFSDPVVAYFKKLGRAEFPTVPVGVFPYSSKCYTYDCQPGGLPCYSYICPNRKISSALGRGNSSTTVVNAQENVWANSVPASLLAEVSKRERDRQEAIFEVINTEHNYIRDLELMDEIFINPLRAGDIVEDAEKREALIADIFLNFREILALNKKMLEDLRQRQQKQPLVESIGDILLAHIAGFEPAYLRYVPRTALSEFTYKREEEQNPKFAQFLKDCTRHPEARRLNLRHFVSQPYQRIPRYALLLAEVIKKTDETVPDRATVEEVIKMCKELGTRVNDAIPEGHRQVRLLTLQDKIIWKAGGSHDLQLSEKSRKLHFECIVKRRSHLEMVEIRIFLFDQALLMTKEKRDKMGDKENMLYQVSKNPIPLELLHVLPDDIKQPLSALPREATPGRKLNNSTKSTGSGHRNSILSHDATGYRVGFQETKYISPVTIEHKGRRGGIYTLYMTPADKEQFLEQIAIAQARRQEEVSGFRLFKTTIITHHNATPPIPSSNLVHNPMDGRRATCSAPYFNVLDGKRRVVIGTEEGVYVGMEDDPYSFRLAIKEQQVSQVSVLEAYHILLVLTGKVLKAFNLSSLDPNSEKSLQVGQQLGKSVQYFTAGVCAGRTLVITMKKKNAGESHFSVLEPVENAVLGGHHHKGFSLSFGKSNKSEWFKPYTEFYVGTDSSQLLMLSKMVCVVCPKGFEILMLDNLRDTQVFPSRRDEDYAFLDQRPGSVPISMFKITPNEFLMCYSDFAFKMSKKGELVSKKLIEWEGCPESFAVAYPYVIAFESGLIEIRHIETGALEQIILGSNIRRLYSSVEPKKDNGMKEQKDEAVIQLVMSDPNNPEIRQIIKFVKATPPPKTALEPAEYQCKPVNHLMAPALQPVLSVTGSGPAVLTAPGHPSNSNVYQQPGLPPNYQLGSPPPPRIPNRPSPRLSQPIIPAYPIHPYSPTGQAYPQVLVPLEAEDPNGFQQQQPQGGHAITWSSGGYP